MGALKARVYIDTSVIGGCEDSEFQEYSQRLMTLFAQGNLIPVVSDLTLHELAAAPEKVRAHLARVPQERIEVLQFDAEAAELAEAYVSEGVVAARLRIDAQHIAVATVARVDVLVS